MDIKRESSKIRKKIEKLEHQLQRGQALSEAQMKQKEDKIEELREKFEGIEKN